MSTRKATTAATATAATAAAATAGKAAPGKQAKLPTTTYNVGKLSVLSLLTAEYTRPGYAFIGLDQLEADEQVLFRQFLEYAGDPLEPLDLERLLRVSVEQDKETGVFALKRIMGFAAMRDGDRIVLTLGANAWEVEQEPTAGGSVFKVGRLTSTLNCSVPKEGETGLSTWFNWRVRDEAAGAIFEWSEAPVFYLKVDGKVSPTMVDDLKGVMIDGDDLTPLLGLKVVSEEPVWKLAYPDGDDSQPPLDMPVEYTIVGVTQKTYVGGSGQTSRIVRLLDAPYEAVSVRGNAALTVDALINKGMTTIEPGTYKLQILKVTVEGEGAAKKHYTSHQIVRGAALTINVDAEEADGADEEETEEYEDSDAVADTDLVHDEDSEADTEGGSAEQ